MNRRHLTQCNEDCNSSKAKFSFPNEAMIATLARVVRVVKLPDQNEMLAYCKGLDSMGFVFDLELVFMSDDFATLEWVIEKELQTGVAYAVEGSYTVQNGTIRLHDPEFGRVNSAYNVDILAVFAVNENNANWLADNCRQPVILK